MQQAKGPDRQGMAQHATESAIRGVLNLAEPVPVDEFGLPGPNRSGPGAEGILSARFGHKRLAAPAIMIPADPQHGDTRVVEVGQRRQHAKPGARHGMAPSEPEIEKVAHDHQRTGARRHVAQQPQQGTLGVL